MEYHVKITAFNFNNELMVFLEHEYTKNSMNFKIRILSLIIKKYCLKN